MSTLKQIQAVIGLATRGRPKMLHGALESVTDLHIPAGVSVTIIVVENDVVEASRPVVETTLKGHNWTYVLEPEIGIAHARNRVVELAKQSGADVLLFFDDDEILEADWLSQMIGAWASGQGQLIGGPVRIRFEWKPESRYRAFVQRAIVHHYGKREKRTAKAFSRGGSDLISTNNCLIDMSLFTRNGLMYSTEFHTGSDKHFYRQAQNLGIKMGWVAAATVLDRWPPHRTSLRYNFFRAAEQEKTRFANSAPRQRLGYALRQSVRYSFFILLLIASLLPSRGYAIIGITRMAGKLWGLLAATFGSRSSLYSVPTGN